MKRVRSFLVLIILSILASCSGSEGESKPSPNTPLAQQDTEDGLNFGLSGKLYYRRDGDDGYYMEFDLKSGEEKPLFAVNTDAFFSIIPVTMNEFVYLEEAAGDRINVSFVDANSNFIDGFVFDYEYTRYISGSKVSPNGSKIAILAGSYPDTALYIVTRQGDIITSIPVRHYDWGGSGIWGDGLESWDWLSEDELIISDGSALYHFEIASGSLAEISRFPGFDLVGALSISPDGKTIAFGMQQPVEEIDMYTIDMDGKNLKKLLGGDENNYMHDIYADWSKDGKTLIVRRKIGHKAGGYQHYGCSDILYQVPVDSQNATIPKDDDFSGPVIPIRIYEKERYSSDMTVHALCYIYSKVDWLQ